MEIINWVLGQADADSNLSEEAKLAVLAALEGESELDDALGGHYAPPVAIGDAGADNVNPVPAFLKSVAVSGFRGIGAHTALTLNPAPGLIVVAGRNGSGKSSFAEAIEIALTGNTYRGQKKQALWQENWRNLHQPDPGQIQVQLAAEGHGLTTIGVEWAADDQAHDNHSSWVQVHGQKRQPGRSSLGWNHALELYRPLLSYDELGGMLEDAPSRLHDALESILGLEHLADAATRIATRVKALRGPARDAKAQVAALVASLQDLDDDRAQVALAELRSRKPSTTVVRDLVTGRDPANGPALGRLEGLGRAKLAEPAAVEGASELLHTAAAEYATLQSQMATAAHARDSLLAQALSYHKEHGNGPCPICGTGTLDSDWTERTRAHLQQSEQERTALAEKKRELETARQQLGVLLEQQMDLDAAEQFALPTSAAARAAHDEWRSRPAEDLLLAQHARTAYPSFHAASTKLIREAADEFTRRQDRWAELVVPLTRWLDFAEQAAESAEAVRTAEAADKWIKANLTQLRNQRLEPFADQSRAIWARLRQESNVDLGAIRLEGMNTRRHVDLRAAVDGDDAGALAVMSQGELHALALALFIPRATAEASPFGFIILDDPIQAMDPAKIDGFLHVLTELAASRQVIVFSHDDRLPDVLRQTSTPAHILEITRGVHSSVTIADALDPAQRYLDDAYGVAKDANIQAGDKARIIPGLCRLAVEAISRDIYYARQLASGAARAETEHVWQEARKTGSRVALAVNPKSGNLDSWITGGTYRKRSLGVCTSAVHAGLTGDPVGAVEAVRKMVEDLRALR